MSRTSLQKHSSEAEAREVAEQARQAEWESPSFLKELFLGNLRLDLVSPFPLEEEQRPEFRAWYQRLEAFLRDEVDPDEIDRTGEYGDDVIDGLRELGAFGMKIPKEYSGLGFTQVEYGHVMELLGSHDANLTALLSAHQSIGVPQPLKLYGNEALKKKYLPMCAKGAISAFALTEPDVGSDPSALSTTCQISEDGEHYVLNGTKLWCTNGTIAELFVVMARHPESKKISAFVVEAGWEGVHVEHRCRFMGLKAIANAQLRFENVKVPAGNLIGAEGRGLKIALATLNTGRLSLPAGAVGTARRGLAICRAWCEERVQWGRPIGEHEAVAHYLADMAATTFAMESLSRLADQLADRGGYDIRLEAAAAKEWNSVEGWRLVDLAMQIRGGRGYETQQSLDQRGETGESVERMVRDSRINRIFEGSSEIMHLFIAREAVDEHLRVAGDLVDPKKGLGAKLAALPKIAAFYARWYPTRWFGWGRWPRFSEYGALAKHLRFVERNTRRLSRQVFHGMVRHGPGLERKQGFLFRIVDIGLELLAMTATLSRAHSMKQAGHADAARAEALAAGFCRLSRRRVKGLFRNLWFTSDAAQYRLGREILDGSARWLETEALGASERARGHRIGGNGASAGVAVADRGERELDRRRPAEAPAQTI